RISGEPEVAETLIASLGDLLRGLLQAGERDFSQLRDELQFVELYLGLQIGRFADRLTVHVQSGPDVPAVWVPSLILQPLVENAVVHGLADHSGSVRVDVTYDLAPERLQLQVVNSTVSSDARTEGLGLRNVRERLAVQFGERAVLTSGPVDSSTWEVTLTLPVLREWHDEPAARKALRERCATEQDIDVVGEYADAESALAALPQQSPDLIFLDVKMGRISGMQLAQALESGAAPLVVFVTAFDRYALQAFEVNAADFLLKPFDRERFRTMLRRLRERYAARNSSNYQIAAATLAELQRLSQTRLEARPRLLAETGGSMHMVDVAQIELVSANRNYVVLTVGKESFHARSTLIQAEESMRSQPMLQINRSCMVNVNHVRQVSRTPRGDYVFVLSGGTTVTSSERFRHKVREHIGQFVVGGSKD